MDITDTFEHRQFESAGSTLCYLYSANPGRPALVVLPGYQETARAFYFVEPWLQRSFELYLLDWRGHGESPPLPEGTYGVETLLHDLAMFESRVLPPSIVVLGHCMGADLAAAWAALSPARVQALVLVGGLAGDIGDAAAALGRRVDALKAWFRRVQFAAQPGRSPGRPPLQDEEAARQALAWAHPGLGERHYEVLVALLTRRDRDRQLDWHYAAHFPTRWPMSPLDPRVAAQLWRQVDCPVLWMTREAAPGSEREAEIQAVRHHFQRMEYRSIAARGEDIHHSHPDDVQQQMARFLESAGLFGRIAGTSTAEPRFPAPDEVEHQRRTPRAARPRSDDPWPWLRAEIARLLDLPAAHISPETPPGDLGLDSLAWTRLLLAARETTGAVTTLSQLRGCLTLADMASAMAAATGADAGALALIPDRDPASWRDVLPLQTGSAWPPLFFVGGSTGAATLYMEFARGLPQQPFLVFLPPGASRGEAPLDDVVAVAARLTQRVRSLQPQGPYLLGGHSFGGAVAYEAAVQLRRQGADIARTLVLDTPLWQRPGRPPDEAAGVRELTRILAETSGRMPASGFEAVVRLPAHEQRRFLDQAWRDAGHRAEDLAPTLKLHLASRMALLCYRPSTSDVPITLFVAEQGMHHTEPRNEAPDAEGSVAYWERVCTGPKEIVYVPGHHLDMVLAPHVATLAARCRHCLRRTAAASARPGAVSVD